ncbi:tyrosine-protein phosphatase [Nocardia harenae]|uniref:tyrosine-protein phosphatase n=1 Tax=Nocardia harenae TaxID=358707 RepID=UPI000832610F|nr:tyrosine-protein phosphatase [Nocardia harenae]
MTVSPSADHLRLSGTFNFRDVGGLRTAGGGAVRSGVLLRSAALTNLDAAGHALLRELDVTAVHDLRGLREIDHLGADSLPGGVRLVVTPFDSRMGEAPPHEARQSDTARAHMLGVYRLFPALPEANLAITELARSIANGTGATLVHCAAGKDRTGWAVATLLRAVGVAEDEVVADYLRSNDAVPALRAMIAGAGAERGAEVSADLLGVRPEYLAVATDAVRELHGDPERYYAALGLTDELRDTLRARLLD